MDIGVLAGKPSLSTCVAAFELRLLLLLYNILHVLHHVPLLNTLSLYDYFFLQVLIIEAHGC